MRSPEAHDLEAVSESRQYQHQGSGRQEYVKKDGMNRDSREGSWTARLTSAMRGAVSGCTFYLFRSTVMHMEKENERKHYEGPVTWPCSDGKTIELSRSLSGCLL